MKRRKIFLLVAVLSVSIICMAYFVRGQNMNISKNQILKMGILSSWKSLIPSLQSTAYADLIMGNIYEPLILSRNGGVINSKGAINWEISSDYKKLKFTIDTNKRFSNGDYLTAQDYKDAWEHGLKLMPNSSNNSTLDALYKILGYSEFEKTGNLAGVRIISRNELEIEFSSPFRMGLQLLSDNRYAAYKIINGKYIGTGPYYLEQDSGDFAILKKNHYYSGNVPFAEIQCIRVENGIGAEELLLSEKIDAISYMGSGETNACFENDSIIKCTYGYDTQHRTVEVNGMPGKLFSDSNMRKAIQALIWKKLRKSPDLIVSKILKLDPQIMLPFQGGRLDDDEAEAIVLQGEKYIQDLVDKTNISPIMVIAVRPYYKLIFDYLKEAGIKLTGNSGFYDFKTALEMTHKTREHDLYFAGFSIWDGDPDSIYHKLGKNGAISSPIVYRKKVADLLEEGRKILDVNMVNPFYKNVSRAVLEEVPLIHLGFMPSQVAYNSKRVLVPDETISRKIDNFTIYSPVE